MYHGVVYQASTGTRNKRDAEGIASKARLDVLEGTYNIKRQKKAPQFKDAMADFLEWSRQEHAEHPNTAKRYEDSAKPLVAAFGAKRLHAVTLEDVERYKAARLNQGEKKLKPATVNAELACLRAMLNHFVRLKVITAPPRVKLLAANNEKMRVVSIEEEKLYLAACSQPLHDIAVLMIETGMRPEELYRMRVENVNLEASYVFNPHGKTKAARRKLPLTKRAADVLKARLAGEYVFPFDGDPARPMGKASDIHAKVVVRSGVAHFRLYDLRHTFATRAVESGVDLVTLAALLGHSKIQMVLRYAHPTEGHQAQAIRKMEEFQTAKQMEEAKASDLVQ